MLEKNYSFDENEQIKNVKIGIHYYPECLRDLKETGIEQLAVYGAIGLRNDYGSDMENLYCDFLSHYYLVWSGSGKETNIQKVIQIK